MSDNSDKTVFKQPTPGGDRTGMRPMPGGRTNTSQPSERGAPMPPRAQPIDNGGSHFRADGGLNPLVNAASTLIAVFEKTRQSMSHPNVGALHQRLIHEIKTFENRARDLGIRQEIILSSRYLLCSVLDEAVLNTPWGSESAWGQRTLLTVFHSETSGGEKSFLILDRMRQSPSDNLEIIELFYIFISLGFEGRYRLINRGREALEQIREELFSIIRRHRGEYERALSNRWAGLGNIRNPLSHYIPLWVVVTFMLAVLFFSFTGLRYWLHTSAVPVVEQLTVINNENNAK